MKASEDEKVLGVLGCLNEKKVGGVVAYCMAKPQGQFKTRALSHQIYLMNA
jgi:hypothetical protein